MLARSAKPKLKIVVGGAWHFLSWELPYYAKHFDLVTEPRQDATLLVFGPDVLPEAAELPARRRVAVLFPGFGCNPYHNLDYRRQAIELIDAAYDMVFIQPGPLELAYAGHPKVVTYPLSIDVQKARGNRYRKSLDSLLHASADFPQKDWRRSERIMKLSGLRYEVFPSRETRPVSWLRRMKGRVNGLSRRAGFPAPFRLLDARYESGRALRRKFNEYDGFVHVAAEQPNPIHIDGKYTITLLEAGASGAILFWHDTFGLGNDLQTVFDLPLEPDAAACRIKEIRSSLDVATHSRRTAEEILEKFDPERCVGFRAEKIKELM